MNDLKQDDDESENDQGRKIALEVCNDADCFRLGVNKSILIKPSEIKKNKENFPAKIWSERKLKEMIETVHH